LTHIGLQRQLTHLTSNKEYRQAAGYCIAPSRENHVGWAMRVERKSAEH